MQHNLRLCQGQISLDDTCQRATSSTFQGDTYHTDMCQSDTLASGYDRV